PTLSLLSVSAGPECCLRHRCSSRYLRISPLHQEFRTPLPDSSHSSIEWRLRVEPGVFTPDLPNRLRALYAQSIRTTLAPYVLPRLLARSWPGLLLQVPSCSSLLKGVYNPKAFVPHEALLRQAFAHCARFPTAASRRSLGRVSVPVWLVVLSDQLPVGALVGRYPTNKLIGREPLPKRNPFPHRIMRSVEGIRY